MDTVPSEGLVKFWRIPCQWMEVPLLARRFVIWATCIPHRQLFVSTELRDWITYRLCRPNLHKL